MTSGGQKSKGHANTVGRIWMLKNTCACGIAAAAGGPAADQCHWESWHREVCVTGRHHSVLPASRGVPQVPRSAERRACRSLWPPDEARAVLVGARRPSTCIRPLPARHSPFHTPAFGRTGDATPREILDRSRRGRPGDWSPCHAVRSGRKWCARAPGLPFSGRDGSRCSAGVSAPRTPAGPAGRGPVRSGWPACGRFRPPDRPALVRAPRHCHSPCRQNGREVRAA